MEKDHHFDRKRKWGSALTGVGFAFLLGWASLLSRDPDYVNHIAGRIIFKTYPDGRRQSGNAMLQFPGHSALRRGLLYNADEENQAFAVVPGKIEIISYIPGDINGDGSVNNKDVVRLQRFLKTGDVEIH